MRLWEYVLAADDKIDLVSERSGRAWAASSQGLRAAKVYTLGEDDEAVGPALNGDVTPDEWDAWRLNVRAFRSVVARLTDRKPRRAAGVKPMEADKVLVEHVSRLEVVIDRAEDKAPVDLRKKDPFGPQTPLSKDTFRGLFVARRNGAGSVADYWQPVFLSIVGPGYTKPVCGDCGEPLSPTKTGRTSTAERCKGCTFKLWRSKQPIEDLRASWRKDQQKKRRLAKLGGKTDGPEAK